MLLNRGNVYDPNTGVFKAPMDGLYQISVTISSNAGSELRMQLIKNNERILKIYGPKIHGGSETANPVLELKNGDKISVKRDPAFDEKEQQITGHLYSYFSGFYISE